MMRLFDRRRAGRLSLVLACAALAWPTQLLLGAVKPVVSGYAPAATVSVVELESITVLGSSFQRGLTVKLTDPAGHTSTLSAARVSQVGPNSFQFQARFPSAGAWRFTVTNPDGAVSDPFTLDVTDRPQPVITAVNPASPLIGTKEQTLTVQGSGFRTGLSVYVSLPGGGNDFVNDIRVSNLTATQFDISLILDHTGRYTLWVTDPDGPQSHIFPFTVVRSQAPVAVTGVTPANLGVSADLQVLHVTGSGFQAGLAATLTNPSAGTTVLAGAGRIANVNATSFDLYTLIPEPGTHSLKVTNSDGGQSAPFSFQVGDTAAPQITGILPAPLVASPESVTMTVLGSGFTDSLFVTVLRPDGTRSYFANAQLLDWTPTSFRVVTSFTTPGAYTLQVENGAGAKSQPYTLAVGTVSTAPVVLSYAPLVLQQGTQLQTVAVQGLNFQPGLKAVWITPRGVTVPADLIDPALVTATSFPVTGSFGDEGAYLLQVINPDLSKSEYFPVRVGTPGASHPVLTSHTPNPIAASASLRSLQVEGGDFLPGLTATLTLPDTTTVTYSADQVQGVTFSSFVISASFPQAGDYTLRIQNPDGSQSDPYAFAVDPAPESPTISSMAPTPVRVSADGQTLSLSGYGFLPGLSVRLTVHPGSGAASTATLEPSQVQYVSATSLLVTVSLPNAYTYDLQIDNPDGTQSNVFSFTVLPAIVNPSISDYSPSPYFYLLGQNLQTGLTVTVWPGTGDAPYQITGLSPICAVDSDGVSQCLVQLPLTFAYTGTWRFRAFNPDGGMSSTFEIAF